MRLTLLFVLTIFGFNLLTAQMEEPVTWTFTSEKVSETEYNIIFTADIDRGWSVYSQFLGQGGPIPTSFEFDKNNLQLLGDASENGQKKEVYDKIFGMKLTKFVNKAKFTQRVKVQDGAKEVKGFVTYMTCDESSCMPPTDVKFNIDLK